MGSNNASGKVLGYVFGSAQAIVEFFVQARPSFQNDAPLTCKLQFSDDTTTGLDGTWTDATTTVTFTAWSASQVQRYTIPSTDQSPNYDLSALALTLPTWSAASGVNQSPNYALPALTLTTPSWRVLAPGRVTELGVATLAAPTSAARTAELGVAVVGQPVLQTFARIAELGVAALAAPTSQTGAQVAELDVGVLAYVGPCGTNRCQTWKITRKDGTVFAFTSLDSDITWLGTVYKTCASLAASATESSSNLGSIGSQELTGMLTDDSITQEDIYAGLFDDAYVEVWVIPYDGQPDDQAPFRISAGYLGKVTRQEYAFKAEVLGPGARLQQTSLVDFYTPGCSFDFGVLDDDGIGCPVDSESLKLAAVPVTGQSQRTLVFFTHATPGGTSIWNGGKVRWLTGKNAGVECQVNTVDFSAEALQLWDVAPYPPVAGDTFDLIPGCPKTGTACKIYGVYISFGGFPDVPGPDALQSNADSLFTG
ncbi:MAG TPA: DUF2163 domain-containing protein [Caulobacteraceae bacterium]